MRIIPKIIVLFFVKAKGEDAIKGDLDKISKKLDQLEMAIKKEGYKVPEPPKEESKPAPVLKPPEIAKKVSFRVATKEDDRVRDDLVDPLWIESEDLGDGEIKFLKKKELRFWKDLIKQYLLPLEKNAEKEKQVAAGLKELRNMVAFSFLMINAIWVLTIFMLQNYKYLIFISWPWPSATTGDTLQLEPIALVFMIFFLVVLIIQMIGMLIHRIMTLGHVVSTTKISFREKKFNANDEINKNGVKLVKSIIKNVVVSLPSAI